MSSSSTTSTTSSSSSTLPDASTLLRLLIHLIPLADMVASMTVHSSRMMTAIPPRRMLKFCSSRPRACLIWSNIPPPLLGPWSSTTALISQPPAEVCTSSVSLLAGERSMRCRFPRLRRLDRPSQPSSASTMPYLTWGPLGPTTSKKTCTPLSTSFIMMELRPLEG